MPSTRTTTEVDDLKARYRAGKVGDVEVKTKLATALNAYLAPIRERRAAVLAKPDRLREILFEGSKRARAVAPGTMERVRDAVKISYHEPMDHTHDFESAADAFPVKLVNFEGPLDLLLHLIRKHEVNIHDIPIALITAQYLDAIALLQELNLDVAGEYLVMAATLIHIKSKMLLPRPETAAGVEGEEEDPRDALVRRLLEHQKFKAAAGPAARAGAAACRAVAAARRARRGDRRRRLRAGARSRSLQPAHRVSGRRAARQAAAEDGAAAGADVGRSCASISCSRRLSETEACGFDDLFADVDDRSGLIVTFLALLEMIRLKLVRVFQSGSFGPIRVYKRARPADAPHPIGDPEGHRG